MTPRMPLWVALIGLVIAAFCAIALYFIGDVDPENENAALGVSLLGFGGILALIVFVVGLIIGAATWIRGNRREPS